MLSWIHVVDTPHYAITDAKGAFKIAAIPPGDYRIRVWHEGVGQVNKAVGPNEIKITDGAKEKLEFKVVGRKTN